MQMKISYLSLITLLSSLTFTVPISVMAQDPPAETYQPGYWQPVARFDTRKPVEIKLFNKTELPLEYDLTDLEFVNPETLPPGETGTLQNFGDSAYVVIYSIISNTEAEMPFTLRFKVNVTDENVVMVTIEKAEPNFFGHRTLNLQKNGGIYLY